MGSLSSPPTITATASIPVQTTSLQTPSRLSSFKNRTRSTRSSPESTKVSCNSKNYNDDQFQLNPNANDKTRLIFDRRNMLIGLGGMYGAALTFGGAPGETFAKPIAPDVSSCTLTDASWDGSVGDHCCPPKFDPASIVDFKFENYPSPVMRVRRPAHIAMLDSEWLADYKNAIGIMRSLPMTDPRSFLQQARVHCAYCDGAYPVFGDSDQRLEVHASWLFASFHRWYLYFFERICGKLINKPGFALPYWNWDHPDGMRMPEMFKEVGSPLFDPNRNPNHFSRVVDLSYNNVEHDYPDDKQIQENLLLMRKQMLYPTKPLVFFGAPYRLGDIANPDVGAGALELSPHNNVHFWVGSDTVKGKQDMGSFWSAARDPIFYCHHSNVDRMWNVWRNELPGRSRLDINDPDYLDAYFVFYDENATPVKCYVKDSFDTEKLGYKFEQQELPWLFKTSPPPAKKKLLADDVVVTFPKALDSSVIKTKVTRPRKSRTKEEKEQEEEILLIRFELGMPQQFVKFDVYVNDDYDHKPGEKTQVKPQFAGSFTSLTHRGSGGPKTLLGKAVGGVVGGVVGGIAGGVTGAITGMGGDVGGTSGMVGMGGMSGMVAKKSTLRLAITKLLEDLGASEDEAIQVTIVPISGAEGIVITDVKVDFVA